MTEAVKFLPQIKAAFKYVLPIAVAMNESHPYEEEDITYPNFEQYIAGQVNASNADMPSQLDASLGQKDASSSASASSSVSSVSGSVSSGAAAAVASGSSAKSSASAGAASPSQSKTGGDAPSAKVGAFSLMGGLVIAVALASL
jgi:hypothetical protein